ncbi:MAG UNVERIFIED_CONTAM: hypothetical protein LVR18_24785 [Planctomycetaceae bacterium]
METRHIAAVEITSSKNFAAARARAHGHRKRGASRTRQGAARGLPSPTRLTEHRTLEADACVSLRGFA